MTEKPPEKRYVRLNMEVQDFVGMLLALIGLVLLAAEWPGPAAFTMADYAGIALIVLGFLILLFGGWAKIKWT